MLFGMNRVSGRVHVASTIIVAVGTTLSAFWILALNSWMQTPTGHVIENGVLIAGSWLAVIFNPSFPYRLTHMLLASGITASFLVAGLSAWRLLKAPQRSVGGEDAALRRAHRRGAGAAADLRRRPARPEHAQAPAGEDRRAGGAVEDRARRGRSRCSAFPTRRKSAPTTRSMIPKGAALILAHDADAELKGLDAFKDHPPVAPVFFAFRIMVGMGVLMLAALLGRQLGCSESERRGGCCGLRRLHLLRLGRDARRLDGHRDRPPAVAGHRNPAHRGRGRRRERRASSARA